MLRTKEELLSYMPPFADAKARSDMAWHRWARATCLPSAA
jgi:hypothetical protein